MSCEQRSLNFDQWKNIYWKTLLLLAIFLQIHSNSKELSYLSWQNTYPKLEKYLSYNIKLKFFLCTKLLENLLLAKYLISIAADSTVEVHFRNLFTDRKNNFSDTRKYFSRIGNNSKRAGKHLFCREGFGELKCYDI